MSGRYNSHYLYEEEKSTNTNDFEKGKLENYRSVWHVFITIHYFMFRSNSSFARWEAVDPKEDFYQMGQFIPQQKSNGGKSKFFINSALN